MTRSPTPNTPPQPGRRKPTPWYKKWALAALRSWKTVVCCLPALAVAGAALSIGLRATNATSTRELVERYDKEATRSRRDNENARAMVCLERLVQVEPGRPDHEFRLALAHEARGDGRRAGRMVRSLATRKGRAHAPAQVAWARHLLRAELSERGARDVESLLRQALEANPRDAEARQLLGELFLRLGRGAEAAEVLATSVGQGPGARLLLAYQAARAGKRAEAGDLARSAESEFRKRAEEQPHEPAWFVNWAMTRALQDDHEGAVRIVEDQLAQGRNVPAVLLAIGNLVAAWAERLAAESPGDLEGRLNVLARGQRLVPGHPALQVWLLRELTTAASRETAKRRFEALLDDRRAAPATHFLLGGAAFQLGETDEARHHFERAHALVPSDPTYANNLAWCLADGDEADQRRALELIGPWLARAPQEVRFHGTYGHILLRMKRWREAVPELEGALASNPNERDLHKDLAEAYEALGHADLAALHGRRAQDLADQPKTAGE